MSDADENVRLADLGQAELNDSFLSAADLEADTPVSAGRQKVADSEPSLSDPKWSEYVMSQFEDDELDPNGNPLVHGLRRVARLLLGPILVSKATVVSAPQLLGGFERTTLLQPTTVEYVVKLLMCKLEQGMTEAYEVEFADCADVYFGNTDPDYARHASATAATKAEARCLRKALQLRNVAAEETTKVPVEMAAADGNIDPVQVNFINVLCARNNVNVMKYVNAGKKKYENIEDVPYGVAAKMVEHLSHLQNKGEVPENLRGYEKSWRQ